MGPFLRAGWVRQLISVALILISGVASFQVVHGWKTIEPLESLTNLESSCVTWLRQTNPNAFLSIWTGHYIHIWDYLDNQVRHWTLGTDFYPASALKPTLLTDETLLQTPTQYALVYGGELDYALIQGFKNDPPNTVNNDNKDNHCPLGLLMRNPTAFSYAFTAPLDAMQMDANIIPVNVTTPISSSNYIHGADYIGLVVDSDPNRALVVTTQDTAYPGWQVQINGKTAKLESVGGQIGVILPPGQGQNQILFQYLPPLWLLGSKITLLGCLLCIAFLLRIERLIPKSIVERVQSYKVNARAMATAQAVRTWQKTAVFLTDDHAFDPEKNDLPLVSLLLSAGAQKELPAPKRPIEVLIESVDETGDPPDQV